MKRFLVLCFLFSGVLLHLACADKGSAPTNPPAGIAPQITPTGTLTPGTPTSTPTLVPGANTPTPTPTFILPVVPVFRFNYGTVAAPNGLVIDAPTSILTVAEFETSSLGSVPIVQNFDINPGGTLTIPSGQSNFIVQGIPTPNATPPWAPTTVILNGPQGFVNPGGFGGYASILDNQPGGGANLYYGDSSMLGWTGGFGVPTSGFIYQPYVTTGYGNGGIPFNNPKGMTADSFGYVYVADTGNHRVEQFYGNSLGDFSQHYWTGGTGVTFGGFTSKPFKSPYAVACDYSSPATIWVGDVGYLSSLNTSVIQAFSSGGTTISAAWPAKPGCVVHGIAVHPTTGNIYIADAGNYLIEIYSPTGTFLGEFGDPGPSAHEFLPFAPSCIAFSPAGYIYVGDTNNDYIDVFQ